MKILLVKPQPRLATIHGLQRLTLLEPLELGYLAAALPYHHEIQVLDLRLHRNADRAFTRTLASFKPDLVGFSAYSHEGSIVKRLAAITKAILPKVSIVVGGHHATVAPEDLNVPSIDAIVRGEGCFPFAALVAALEMGRSPASISQVVLTGERFDPLAAQTWPLFPNPATLPVPRRDLWDWKSYYCVWVTEDLPAWHPLFPPTAMVRTSFGCTMKCTFCVVPFLCGGQHMPRPAAAVAKEIAGLPANHVYFCDDENFIDEKFAGELADELEKRNVHKRYFAWTRATTVNRSPELIRRWRSLGLDGAFLGFEFPSDEELKTVHKGGSVAANERALDTLRSIGVAVHAAFMLRPEYDRSDFARLSRYVQSLPPAQCSFNVCTPSPGTPDYEAIKSNIWVDNPYDLHDCMHPLTPTTLPLVEFCQLYARQVADGVAKTPLRTPKHPVRPWDTMRAVIAGKRYERSYRMLFRDYPKELWGGKASGKPD